VTERFKELQELYRLLGGLSEIATVAPKGYIPPRVKLTRRLNKDFEMIA
jgi:hypothetical protein